MGCLMQTIYIMAYFLLLAMWFLPNWNVSKDRTFFLNMHLENGFKKVLVSPSLVLTVLIQYTSQDPRPVVLCIYPDVIMAALNAEGKIVGTRLGHCACIIEDDGKPEIRISWRTISAEALVWAQRHPLGAFVFQNGEVTPLCYLKPLVCGSCLQQGQKVNTHPPDGAWHPWGLSPSISPKSLPVGIYQAFLF